MITFYSLFTLLASDSMSWPTWQQLQRVVLLHDYNTRVVVFGTAVLGFAAGLVGSFTLLRRRALMGDALAHATLPGICLAFMLITWFGGNGKSLSGLLTGAALSGLLGVLAIMFIRRQTRLKEDAALGITLSVFFGAGTALLGLVQQMESGHAAGLESFIYGKTASMIAEDAWLVSLSAIVCIVVSVAMFKELKLLCFDDAFAGSQGFPVSLLDAVLMMMVVIVTIVGLQAVGLVLIIALLVIPAASARFWTDRMRTLAIWSACLGSISCLLGAGISALFPRLPSGAMIVLTAATIFLCSMFAGTKRGLIVRIYRRRTLNQRIDDRHLLRAVFEATENMSDRAGVSLSNLLDMRSWSKHRLRAAADRQARAGLITVSSGGELTLTDDGLKESARLVREHRMWEMYLINHADIAPSRVDRDADRIEHVLEPEMIVELEMALAGQAGLDANVPPDPHGTTVCMPTQAQGTR